MSSSAHSVDTLVSVDTAEHLRLKDFDTAYDDILSLEANLHKETDVHQIKGLTDNLTKYSKGIFILGENVGQDWADFLREQARTALSVYEVQNGGDFFGDSDIIPTVESQFDHFAEENDLEGMVRSERRLEWLSRSNDTGIAGPASIALENKQDLLEKHNARKQALKGTLTGATGRNISVVALAIGGGVVLALIVGGIVVSTLPQADGSATREGTDTNVNTNPTASLTATPSPTLPMTPTQWLPAGMVGTQLAIAPEAATIEATNMQATQEVYPLVTSTSEPLSAPQEARTFFEMAELTSRDYLQHDNVYAGTILTLPEKTDKAVREKILPFLPEFVRNENVDPITYLYSAGLDYEIGLREDEALAGSDTQARIIRYNLRTEEFDLIQNELQPIEVKRFLQSSLWEFRFTPRQLKNNPSENPYDSNYLYIALQHLDADGVEFSEEDLQGVDQTKLGALLERTIGVEFFRFIGFAQAAATATPTFQPTPSEEPSEEAPGNEGGREETPQPPGETPQPPGETPQPPGGNLTLPVKPSIGKSQKVAAIEPDIHFEEQSEFASFYPVTGINQDKDLLNRSKGKWVTSFDRKGRKVQRFDPYAE